MISKNANTNLCMEKSGSRYVPPSPPLVIARSPLRISFVGGGSDLPLTEFETKALRGNLNQEEFNGRTISTSIDKHVYAFAKRRNDDRVIVHWQQKEDVAHAGGLQHELIREILLREGLVQGVEIATFADVPGVGSGLGSSAATTCACLAAVLALKGYQLSGEELAESAADIELNSLVRKGGRQDQYASAIGGFLEINYENGEVTGWQDIHASHSQHCRLAEHFVLFSPPSRREGRDSDEILVDRADTIGWREECRALCANFRASWNLGFFTEMAELVSNHHRLKCLEFRSYKPLGLDVSMEELRIPYKLCGAGKTGHLLVGVTPATREGIVKTVSNLWGPELPYQMTEHGTEIIHAG